MEAGSRLFWSVGLAVGIAVVTVESAQASWHPSDMDEIRMTTPYTPEKGEFEIYQVTEFLNDGAATSTKTFTRFEYGLTDDLVAEFKVPFRFKRPASGANTEGLGDLDVELKYQLFKEESAPMAVAIGFEVGLPTGDEDRGLGNGGFKYEPILALGKTFGVFSIVQDIKLELIRESGGGVKREGSLTTALTWTPVKKFAEVEHPTLELALDWKWEEKEKAKLALIPGVRGEFEHLPVELEWGLGFPIALNGAADRWGVITAFEVEF